jgi:carbonic anhydrase/acetyltransferase-like protein (isoleucine patch superfamily)
VIGPGNSVIGNLVKLGNYANVFGATLEDEVFVAPMVWLMPT